MKRAGAGCQWGTVNMPIFNTQYTFEIDMPLDANTDAAVSNPAFEAGDWQISYDLDVTNPSAATWANAATLPVVFDDSGTDRVRLTLTANEIGTNATMHARLMDATDPEAWLDTLFELLNEPLTNSGLALVYQVLRQSGKSTLRSFTGESVTATVTVSDGSGTVDLSSRSMQLVIEYRNGTDATAVTATGTTTGFTYSTPDIQPSDYTWSLRDTGTGEVISYGEYEVVQAATVDS